MLLKPAPFVLHVRLSDLGLVRTKGLEFWTLGLTVFNPFHPKTVIICLKFGYECLIPMVGNISPCAGADGRAWPWIILTRLSPMAPAPAWDGLREWEWGWRPAGLDRAQLWHPTSTVHSVHNVHKVYSLYRIRGWLPWLMVAASLTWERERAVQESECVSPASRGTGRRSQLAGAGPGPVLAEISPRPHPLSSIPEITSDTGVKWQEGGSKQSIIPGLWPLWPLGVGVAGS